MANVATEIGNPEWRLGDLGQYKGDRANGGTFALFWPGMRRVIQFQCRFPNVFVSGTNTQFQQFAQLKHCKPSNLDSAGSTGILSWQTLNNTMRVAQGSSQGNSASWTPITSAVAFPKNVWIAFEADITFSASPASGRLTLRYNIGAGMVQWVVLTTWTLKTEIAGANSFFTTGDAVPAHLRLGPVQDSNLATNTIDFAQINNVIPTGILAIGGAAFTADTTVAVAGKRNAGASTALSGQSTQTAGARASYGGSSSLSGDSTFSPLGGKLVGAATAMSGDGSTTVTGGKRFAGSAAITGDSTFTAAGLRRLGGVVAPTGQSTLAVSGKATHIGASSQSGQSNLIAIAITNPDLGSATLSGQATLSADATITSPTALAALTGAGDFSADAISTLGPTANADGAGDLSAAAGVDRSPASGALDGAGTVITSGRVLHGFSADLDGAGGLTVTAQNVKRIALSLTSESTFDAAALLDAAGTVALTNDTNLIATAIGTFINSAQLEGGGLLKYIPLIIIPIQGTVTNSPTERALLVEQKQAAADNGRILIRTTAKLLTLTER